MSVDILGTSCDQCRSTVQYSFTSTETRRLVRTFHAAFYIAGHAKCLFLCFVFVLDLFLSCLLLLVVVLVLVVFIHFAAFSSPSVSTQPHSRQRRQSCRRNFANSSFSLIFTVLQLGVNQLREKRRVVPSSHLKRLELDVYDGLTARLSQNFFTCCVSIHVRCHVWHWLIEIQTHERFKRTLIYNDIGT